MTDLKNNIDFELLITQPKEFCKDKRQVQALLLFIRQRTNKFLIEHGQSNQIEQEHHTEVFSQFFAKIIAIKTKVDKPENYVNRTLSNVMTDLLTDRKKLDQNTESIEDLSDPQAVEQQNKQTSVEQHGDEIPEHIQLFRAWLVYTESMDAELYGQPLNQVVTGIRAKLLQTVDRIKQQFQQLIPDSRERDVSILLCFSQFEWTPAEVAKHLDISLALVSIAKNKVKDKYSKFIAKLDQ